MNIITALLRAMLGFPGWLAMGHDCDCPLTALDVLETEQEVIEPDEPVDYWPVEDILGLYECPCCAELVVCTKAMSETE